MFHVSLLRPYHDNGVHADIPALEVDGDLEFEVAGIRDHRVVRNEL